MKGCTIIEPDGWSKTIEAPDGYFDAHFGSVVIEGDNEASIKQLFNLAPQQRLAILGVLGGGVPAWKLKYAECRTVDDLLAVNPNYKDDVTSDGVWEWPLPNAENLSKGFANAVNIKVLRGVWPKAYYLLNLTNNSNTKGLNEVDLELPGCYAGQRSGHNIGHILNSHATIKARLVLPNVTSISQLCWYTKALRELDLYCPNVTTADLAFTGTILDKKSTLQILDHLKAFDDGKSHPCGIGIHVDHKNDEEVLAAIANAESKGWTMTVQWNGTPTAQAATTYGLRKPPIYAKVSELENGERVLDWGHYVTDPSGYEEFRSVEAAREYYGLPEEPLI